MADLDWQIVATGDFNGDAKPDILWRNDVSGENRVWFMDGATLLGGFRSTRRSPTRTGRSWARGTSTANAHRDIVWWHQVTGGLIVWFMDGITPVQFGGTDHPAGIADTRWRPVAMGDFNRADTQPDIVWRHSESGQNVLWYMGGTLGTTLLGGEFTNPAVFADLRWKIVGPR